VHPQRPPLIGADEMTRFHSDDYINFLRTVTPTNMSEFMRELQKCEWGLLSLGKECWPFGVWGRSGDSCLCV